MIRTCSDYDWTLFISLSSIYHKWIQNQPISTIFGEACNFFKLMQVFHRFMENTEKSSRHTSSKESCTFVLFRQFKYFPQNKTLKLHHKFWKNLQHARSTATITKTLWEILKGLNLLHVFCKSLLFILQLVSVSNTLFACHRAAYTNCMVFFFLATTFRIWRVTIWLAHTTSLYTHFCAPVGKQASEHRNTIRFFRGKINRAQNWQKKKSSQDSFITEFIVKLSVVSSWDLPAGYWKIIHHLPYRSK